MGRVGAVGQGPERHERAGHLGEDAGEVLGTGERMREPAVPVLAEDLAHRFVHERRLGDVVHRGRPFAAEPGFDRDAVRSGQAAQDLQCLVPHPPGHVIGEGAHGGFERCRPGDDVASGPCAQDADGEHDVVEHVEPAGHHDLQGEHHLRGRGDRVAGEVWDRGVATGAPHGHHQR